MKRNIRLALDTTRRENELKPSNSLLKKKASLRIPRLLNTISLFNFSFFINSLTSPAALLGLIHGHSHKYLSVFSPTCEKKPMGKILDIYKSETH